MENCRRGIRNRHLQLSIVGNGCKCFTGKVLSKPRQISESSFQVCSFKYTMQVGLPNFSCPFWASAVTRRGFQLWRTSERASLTARPKNSVRWARVCRRRARTGGQRGRLHEYFIPVVANHLGPFESLTAAAAAAAGREQRGMALIVHRLIGFCK